MDLTGIRKAVAANARTAVGLEDVKHYRPEMVAGSPTFWVEVDSYEPSTLGRTRWSLRLEGKLQILGTWDRSVSDAADTLVDLVWTAIETDGTLDGLAQSTAVLEARFDPDEDGSTIVTYLIAVEA